MKKRIDVVSVFPELFGAFSRVGVVGQAIQHGIFQFQTHNPRNFAKGNYKSIDDRPFGGGAGMVMMAEPLQQTVDSLPIEGQRQVIYLTPQGQSLTAELAQQLSTVDQLVLICGRYEGIDERFVVNAVDLEISVGDFVVSGGEIPAMILTESVSRFWPGVLGNASSSSFESFSSHLLEGPIYTRPREVLGLAVPEVLIDGDHQKIAEFRKHISILRTLERRSDLMKEGRFEAREIKATLHVLESISTQDWSVLGFAQSKEELKEKIRAILSTL